MSAPYYLAIDVGTSRTSAAIARIAPDGSPLATPFPLGRSSDNAPTVAFVADGEVLFGDAAERRGGAQPDRLIREYKRRIGDDVPILAGDRAFAPEELYALTVDWAARAVIEREGDTPVRLAITVPAAWGDHRGAVVRAALAAQGWRDVDVITEPEAAARHYESTNPLPAGRALAVYDFGGGTFDAVVLRKDRAGAVGIVGNPVGIADLGGADFDDTVVRHIVQAAKVDATALAGDTAGRMALAALRRECVEAKESLSFDSEAVVPVILSGDQRTVRLTRDEFELMIADDLDRTIAALEDALEDAAVDLDDVDAILLTGGSSRIPRVAQVLSERFDRPIAIDADPKAIIALGAARAAVDAVVAARAAQAAADEAPAGGDAHDDLTALLGDTADGVAAPARRRWFRKVTPTVYVAGAFAVLLTGAGIAAAPALGSGVLGSNASSSSAEPMELAGAVFGPPLPVSADAGAAAAATPPDSQNADSGSSENTNARSKARTPSTSTNPQRQATTPSQAPSSGGSGGGGTTPANNGGGGTQQQPSNPQPGTSEQPSNPQPGTSEQPTDPGTTEPEPQPTDPGTTEPEPQPEPEPSGTTTPSEPAPTTTETGSPA